MAAPSAAEPASPSPGQPTLCLSCAFPLERDAGLLVLIERFKAMLRYAGYSLRSLQVDGDESCAQVWLRLELGGGEQKTTRKRRREEQLGKRKKTRRDEMPRLREECGARSCGSCASSCCGYEDCEVEVCEVGCDGDCSEDGQQNKKRRVHDDRRRHGGGRSFECESCTHEYPAVVCELYGYEGHGDAEQQMAREDRSTDTEKEKRAEEKEAASDGISPPSLGTLPTEAPVICLDSSRAERGASPANSGTHGRDASISNTGSHRKESGANAGHPGHVKNVSQGETRPSEVDKRSSSPGEPRTPSVLPSHNPANSRKELDPLPLAALNRSPGENGDNAAQDENTADIRPAADPSSGQVDGPKFILQPKRADNRIPCQVEGCDQTFCRASTAKRHFYRLHMGMTGTFTCKYCFKELGDKGTLRMHIQAVHEKRRPWICRECGARFTQSSSLHRHCRDIHNLTRVVKQASRIPPDKCETSSKDPGTGAVDAPR